ncbi:BamA/TamA family outer membrane protein [Mucilaginibacter glaciei]|uniref:BamA/TamA family outer membrane protein n=1 Tax=Mucilaginibacter glaciei TaxID=2772109 RepID=A0A926NNS9_9SPHI|nr:BamA/TamA family outer membrane protein [Mucilaginibacter glaciei]MBD1391880.1 BamA/TamA family outer membrane protein [Mucilaginibacter glaciei]
MIKPLLRYLLTASFLMLWTHDLIAQSSDSLQTQTDLRDAFRHILKPNAVKKDTINDNAATSSILPALGYSPSFGLAIGVTSSGGRRLGNPATTNFSIYNWNAYASTGGLASFEIKHNVYTPDNKFNLLGGIQVGRSVALDYGIGTGLKNQGDGNFAFNNLPFENNPDVFQMRYTYFKINERVYKRLFGHFFAGAGIVADWYGNIRNQNPNTPQTSTHNFRYSIRNNYNPNSYRANGLLFNLEFDSRDHPNRAYKGLYVDVVLRTNRQWLGSTQNAAQLKTELRKYFSLSKQNPEHVLAFWIWGNYLLGGSVPYLSLPGTGADVSTRTGRAYTIGRFKGISFFYSESEYRFPITENKLLSGVVFANVETASNLRKVDRIKLFQHWEPGAGAGLRMLLNKYSRSNICLDYGMGHYGSSGIFLGLNEAF